VSREVVVENEERAEEKMGAGGTREKEK